MQATHARLEPQAMSTNLARSVYDAPFGRLRCWLSEIDSHRPSRQPHQHRRERNHREVVSCELFEAHGDTTEPLYDTTPRRIPFR